MYFCFQTHTQFNSSSISESAFAFAESIEGTRELHGLLWQFVGIALKCWILLCLQYLFDSVEDITVLRCGHTIHLKCLREMHSHAKYVIMSHIL